MKNIIKKQHSRLINSIELILSVKNIELLIQVLDSAKQDAAEELPW